MFEKHRATSSEKPVHKKRKERKPVQTAARAVNPRAGTSSSPTAVHHLPIPPLGTGEMPFRKKLSIKIVRRDGMMYPKASDPCDNTEPNEIPTAGNG